MPEKLVSPALDGWHTIGEDPQLLGSQCVECLTYFFPKNERECKNPNCSSTKFLEIPLSREGRIWSYTNACYQPPAPYVAGDPFEPFAIAAVELELEKLIILGQVAKGIDVDSLTVGMEVDLITEPLHETEDEVKMVWKWRPKKYSK